jgi:hypothetical protein
VTEIRSRDRNKLETPSVRFKKTTNTHKMFEETLVQIYEHKNRNNEERKLLRERCHVCIDIWKYAPQHGNTFPGELFGD